jgi:hypothetical protein
VAKKKEEQIILRRAKNGKRQGRGLNLTLPEQEAIYQSYLALGNKSAVARQFDIHPVTVLKVLRRMNERLSPEEQRERQAAITDQLKGRYYQTTSQIIDSIKPEDLESGRIEVKDSKGEIVGYKEFGPSLVAKATAAGIFTDKIRIISDLERATAQAQQSGELLMPDGVNQLLQAVRGKIQSISVLNVNFREDNPDLATRLDTAMQVAEVEQAEVGAADGRDELFDNLSK